MFLCNVADKINRITKLVTLLEWKKKKCWTASVELMLPDSNRNHRREGTIANHMLCEVSTWLSQRSWMLKHYFYRCEYSSLTTTFHNHSEFTVHEWVSLHSKINLPFSKVPKLWCLCTHRNGPVGSAVCVFTFDTHSNDLHRVFNGRYLQRRGTTNWVSVPNIPFTVS